MPDESGVLHAPDVPDAPDEERSPDKLGVPHALYLRGRALLLLFVEKSVRTCTGVNKRSGV